VHHAKVLIVLAVLLGTGLLAGGGPAAAKGYEGVDVKHARQHVRAAQRDLVRAEARLREARTILDETRWYTSLYGTSVGRWLWLSDDVGWKEPQWPTLFMVIDRESGGSPGIVNSQGSGAAGLLQFMPPWYNGQWGYPAFNPFDPRANLKAGLWLWHRNGWSPWALTAW
jgi:outer membrane murein-binding lipoprotein Lpp